VVAGKIGDAVLAVLRDDDAWSREQDVQAIGGGCRDMVGSDLGVKQGTNLAVIDRLAGRRVLANDVMTEERAGRDAVLLEGVDVGTVDEVIQEAIEL